MSLQTWMEEFYPETAANAAADGDAAAVEHSLRKWEGLKFENLDRHGLWPSRRAIHDVSTGQYLMVNSESCALCVIHLGHSAGCWTCQLYKARGTACDVRRLEELEAPWHTWMEANDPEPMIFWLNKAKEHCNGVPTAPDQAG